MITCPHCGKEFDETAPPKPKVKWYFTTYWVVIAILSVVPFALPLVWFNPRYKPTTKWIVTVVVIIITIIIIWLGIETCHSVRLQWQQLKPILRELGITF